MSERFSFHFTQIFTSIHFGFLVVAAETMMHFLGLSPLFVWETNWLVDPSQVLVGLVADLTL